MGRTLRSALSVAVLIAVMAPAVRGADEPRLDGIYAFKGLNPDGTEYRGVVAVVPEGDTFVVTWMAPYTEGETMVLVPIAVGIGIRDGEISRSAISMRRRRALFFTGSKTRDVGWPVAGWLPEATAMPKLPGEFSEPAVPEPSEDVKPDVPHRSTAPSARRAI
jgi:hypothetical protein